MNKDRETEPLEGGSSYSLVIPTRNRPDFVERGLKYYQACDIGSQIVYADGSTGKHRKTNAETIKKFRDEGVNVRHFVPSDSWQIGDINLGIIERLQRCIDTVETPLIHLVPDDDFVGPRFTEEASKFLLEHADYSSVFGIVCGIYLTDERKSATPYGTVSRLDIVPNAPPIADETAIERLARFYPGYGAVFWSMHRKDVLVSTFENAYDMMSLLAAADHSKLNEACAELVLETLFSWLLNYVAVASGKIHSLPRLGMANHYHGDNWGTQIISQGGLSDAVFDPVWPLLSRSFLDTVSRIVANHDNIPEDEARKVVNACMWRMVGTRLTHSANETFYQATAGVEIERPGPAWRETLKKIGWLRSVVQRIRRGAQKASENKLRIDDVPELQQVVSSIEDMERPH